MGRKIDRLQLRQPAKHLGASFKTSGRVRVQVDEDDAPAPKFAESAAIAAEMLLANLDLKTGKYVDDGLKLGVGVHDRVFFQAAKPVVPITSISIRKLTTVAQDL